MYRGEARQSYSGDNGRGYVLAMYLVRVTGMMNHDGHSLLQEARVIVSILGRH